MLIYVKIIKKMFFIRQTDTRSTQNYSSEPHKSDLDGCFKTPFQDTPDVAF